MCFKLFAVRGKCALDFLAEKEYRSGKFFTDNNLLVECDFKKQ